MCVNLVEMLPNVPTLSDIDECKQVDFCGQHATCNNNEGGYYCICFTGYKASDSKLPPGPHNLCIGIIYEAPLSLSYGASKRFAPDCICRINISVTLCR